MQEPHPVQNKQGTVFERKHSGTVHLCRALPQARSLLLIEGHLLSAIHFHRHLMLESSPVAWIATVSKVKCRSWEDFVLLLSELRSSSVPCNQFRCWNALMETQMDERATVLSLITLVVWDHSQALLKDTVFKEMQPYAAVLSKRIWQLTARSPPPIASSQMEACQSRPFAIPFLQMF